MRVYLVHLDLRLALPVSWPTASWASFTPCRKHKRVPKNCKWAFRLMHFRPVFKLDDSPKKREILDIVNFISFLIFVCNLWNCEYQMRKSWVTAYLHGGWYFQNFVIIWKVHNLFYHLPRSYTEIPWIIVWKNTVDQTIVNTSAAFWTQEIGRASCRERVCR